MIRAMTKVLANQRGSILAQNMTGAIISMMVLGVLGAGLVAVMFAQAGVASKTAVSNQINQSSSSLRSDVQWAGNIAATTATDKAMTVVVPGFGGGEKCKVVNWSIAPNGDRTELKTLTRVYQNSTFQASTPLEPVSAGSSSGVMGCSGAIVSERSEVLINDVGPDASFTYLNAGGSTLVPDPASVLPTDVDPEQKIREMKVSVPNPAPAMNLTAANRAKKEATRIAGVEFTGKVAATSNTRATDLDVVQMAENLNRKNLPVSGTESTNLETVSFSLN